MNNLEKRVVTPTFDGIKWKQQFYSNVISFWL